MLCETLANCGEALPFRPSAPVQGRLHDPPAKSNFLAVRNFRGDDEATRAE